ncbi:MAG: response regulator [Gillisia sp.]
MKEIYVVEDDKFIRELLELLLMDKYKVRSFPNAEKFRKSIKIGKPKLILMDIMLPDGNGQEMCKNLAQDKETNDIPVILMSAHADIVDKTARDFIVKPFELNDLLFRIKKHINL